MCCYAKRKFNRKIKKFIEVKDELIHLREFISCLDNFDNVFNNEINETLAGLNDDHGINLDELEKKVSQKENYGNAFADS